MKHLAALLCALAFVLPAAASPGAHGPNGEHLDAPGAGAPAASGASGAPRIETFSELFELVGHLSGGELSVLVDRYETNEPVLDGLLEVEYQGRKARATFHPDMGDYAIDDPAFLEAISAPGKHALLFTLVAGEDSDLLEGTLEVGAAQEAHAHGASQRWPYAALAMAAILAALAAVLLLRRRPTRPKN